MIEQNYIMLIMNCKKYIKKAKFQKMTWLPNIPSYIKYYHVIGEPNLETKYKFDDENQLLLVKVEDDYNSLPKKVIRAYEAVNETFKFKYIFKTDDDQILIKEKFFDVLKGLITNEDPVKKIHYGGYIVDVKDDHISKYNTIHPELPSNILVKKTKYCNGRFYFLSTEAVSNLISKNLLIENEYFEDYAIGMYLEQIYKLNMLNILSNKMFLDIELSNYTKLVSEGII
jgi:hypothetical protein